MPVDTNSSDLYDVQGVVEHFVKHGYARVGNLAPSGLLDVLKQRTDDLMMGRVVIDGLFFQLDSDTGNYEDLPYGKGYEGPSLNYRKLEKLELDKDFLSWIQSPIVEPIVRALLPNGVSIYRAALFNKSAQGGSDLPWHQDGGAFWGVDRDPFLQIWTALDDVPEEAGAVEVIPDTHFGGLVTKSGGVIPKQMIEQRAQEKSGQNDIVVLPAKAGDVLLIHNHVWHRSGRNTSGKPRRALTVCYMDAETKCLRKKHTPRSFFRVFDGAKSTHTA